MGRSVGGPRIGLWAAAVVAVLPLEILHGTMPFPDLMVAALGTWALALVHREAVGPSPQPKLLLAAGALLGWGYMAKQTALFYLVVVAIWALARRRWVWALVALPVVLTVVVEMVVLAAFTGNPLARTADVGADIPIVISQWYGGDEGRRARLLWHIPSLLFNPLAKDFPYLMGLPWIFAVSAARFRAMPGGRELLAGTCLMLLQIWFWPSCLSPYVPALIAEGRHVFPLCAPFAVGAAALFLNMGPVRRRLFFGLWTAACLLGTTGIYLYLAREDAGLREAYGVLRSRGAERVRALDAWGNCPGLLDYLDGPRGKMTFRGYRREEVWTIRGEYVVVDDRTRVHREDGGPFITGRDLPSRIPGFSFGKKPIRIAGIRGNLSWAGLRGGGCIASAFIMLPEGEDAGPHPASWAVGGPGEARAFAEVPAPWYHPLGALMDNRQVSEILETIGRLLDIKGENPFKVRAYHAAARAIAALPVEVEVLAAQKRLGEIPGVGEAIGEKIARLVATGRLEYLEELRREIPEGVLEMTRIPFLGPRKARALWKELGLVGIEELRQACREGRVAALKGFGEKTQKRILEGIEFLARHEGRVLLGTALPLARGLLAHLEACPAVLRASLAGSLRRGKEVVRDIDLLASSEDPERVMEHFVRAEGVAEVLLRGPTKTSVRLGSGLQADLRVVSDAQFPFALAYFTGSKEHNVALRALAQKKGLKVSEYGVFEGERLLPCRDEEEFYARLGLPFLPPEIRENAGELELRAAPALLGSAQLKGVLHVHTDWSDGTTGIEELARKARAMGLSYLGIADHSKAARYANGLDEARLRRQMEEIDRLNRQGLGVTILKGVESDILPDGRLDLDPEVLSGLDFVIGAVHSRFEMGREEMTERICKSFEVNRINIFAHPTGRLLLSREGYAVDLERVIEAARQRNIILELNAHPQRLDLDAVHCRRAAQQGVMVAINPDAHSAASLEDLQYGVATARRGWLEAKDVLNAQDLGRVREILRR